MIKVFLYTVVAYLICTSCNTNKNSSIYYNVDDIKYVTTTNIKDSIKGELQPISIFGIKQFMVVDSLIIATSLSGDLEGLMTIVNIKNNEQLAKICTEGNGPDEYLSIFTLKQLGVNANGDRLLYTFDGKNNIKLLNLTESIKKQTAVVEYTYKVGPLQFNHTFIMPDSGQFIRRSPTYDDPRDNFFYPAKYIVIDNNGKKKDINTYPVVIDNPNYPRIPIFVYEGAFRMKPDNTKVVDILLSLNCMNIIDTKDGSSLGVIEKDSYFFEDMISPNPENMLKLVRQNVLDACITNDYIIMLHDGRTFEQVNKRTKVLKPIIKIFNWQGDFLCGFNISESIHGIGYDESTQSLYGRDDFDRIYKYYIGDLLNKI